MSYSPGQTLTLKSDDHYVYALIADGNRVFYVLAGTKEQARLARQCWELPEPGV
jgi:hypothetical protein